jgi:hypothetical protein
MSREWIRLYTSAHCHRKLIGLALEVFGVWAMALAYAGSQEREDFVPAEWLESVTRDSVISSEAVANQLVARGLWEPLSGGWLIHNHNNRQADEATRREQNRIRQQRWRERKAVTVTPVTRDGALGSDREEKKENEKRVVISPIGESRESDVDQVWEAWVTSTGRTGCKLDSKRRRVIKARLAAFPLADVIDAVRGWERDPWDGRRQNNEITLLLRDAGQLEKFRDYERNGAPAPTVRGMTADEFIRSRKNAIDERIRVATELGRGGRPTTVIDMPSAVADG